MDLRFRATPCLLLTVFGCASAPAPGTTPATAAAAAEPQSPQASGRVLLQPTIDATGGQRLWESVATRDFELVAKLFTEAGERSATSRSVYRMPGDMYRGNALEELGEINMLIRGSDVWFKPPQQESLRPASPMKAGYINAGLWRDLPFLLARVARGDNRGAELRVLRRSESTGATTTCSRFGRLTSCQDRLPQLRMFSYLS